MSRFLRTTVPSGVPEHDRPLYPGNSFNPPRPIVAALVRGLLCRCPACGAGRLYLRFLKVAPFCLDCGEALHHARPDDTPAYFVMLIAGHIAVSMALALELAIAPPLWITIAASSLAACVLTLSLLPPVKGAVIALQWTLWMHGFDPIERNDSSCLADHPVVANIHPLEISAQTQGAPGLPRAPAVLCIALSIISKSKREVVHTPHPKRLRAR